MTPARAFQRESVSSSGSETTASRHHGLIVKRQKIQQRRDGYSHQRSSRGCRQKSTKEINMPEENNIFLTTENLAFSLPLLLVIGIYVSSFDRSSCIMVLHLADILAPILRAFCF
jgi:hypothetical protein